MKYKKYALFVLLSVALAGCSIQPIMTVKNEPIGFNLPVSSVKKAIIDAGTQRDWLMTETKPGVIQGVLLVRTHKAVIDITYNDKSYSIDYVDSQHLDYKNGDIHRNYNRWIHNLDLDIRKNLTEISMEKNKK